MSGLLGVKMPKSASVPLIGAITIQSSAYGMALPILWGRQRIPVNLLWYGDFKPTPPAAKKKKGKGVNALLFNTMTLGVGLLADALHPKIPPAPGAQTYQCAFLSALCEGTIIGIGMVWQDTNIVNPQLIGGTITTASNEVHTIPSGSPYLINVTNAATFVSNGSVSYAAGGAFTNVTPATPSAAGQYNVTANGVYTFHLADSSANIKITYNYRAGATLITALAQLNLTMMTGANGQAVWSYLTANHPTEALAYAHTALIASDLYNLQTSAALPNHSFEVYGQMQFSSGIVDANPKDIIIDFLTNARYGVSSNFPIADLTNFSNYCIASGIFMSPALTSQQDASSILADFLECSNSAAVFSEGVLKIIPYGDQTVTGNGATFTPNLTPSYILTDDDFITAEGEDPVKMTRMKQMDAFNQVQVEFLNRANQYNTQIAEAKDQADIETNGLRPSNVHTYHMICDPSIAQFVAQIRLQRLLYIRNTYEFKLGWPFCLLEPMDIVAINDTGLGLINFPVRIVSIEEDAEGVFTIRAEEVSAGISSAAILPTAPTTTGFSHDSSVPPPSVNTPLMFEPPLALTGGVSQVWVAASGGANWGGCNVWASTDGTTYQPVGSISEPCAYGKSTANLPAFTGTNPDTSNTLSVAINASNQLTSNTADNLPLLAPAYWIGGEIICYQTATLTSAQNYNLTTLQRGGFGTPKTAKPANSDFAVLDSGLLTYTYAPSLIGSTIYLKFTSINQYGGAEESLSAVTAYPYVLTGGQAQQVSNLTLVNPIVGTSQFTGIDYSAQWSPLTNVTNYGVQIVGFPTAADQTANTNRHVLRSQTLVTPTIAYSFANAVADGAGMGTAGFPAFRYMNVEVSATASRLTSTPVTIPANNLQPNQLTGCTAVAGGSTGQITVSWPASNATDLDKYHVWQGLATGFTPGTASYNGAALTTTLTGLTIATALTGGTLAAGTYFYVVTAKTASGETTKSVELTATTTGTTSSNILTWPAMPGATGYNIYRGTSAGAENVFYSVGAVTTYTDTNAASTSGTPPSSNGATIPAPTQTAPSTATTGGTLVAGTYYSTVTALTANGETVASGEQSVNTVVTYLSTPTQNTPTTSTSGGTLSAATYYYKVTAINANGETTPSGEQSITASGTLSAPTQSTPTTSTTGGTLAAATYYYEVTAINTAGETVGSNEQSIATTGTTSSNTIGWTAVTGATGYRIYRGTSAGAESVFYTVGNVTTFNDTGASSTAGTVPASNTASSASNVVNWTSVAGATGYKIYRGTATGAENVFYTVGNVTTFTDTGAANTSGSVPGSNTAAINTASNTINWNAVAGATGYKVRIGTTSGGENIYFTVGNVTTFVYTGSAGTSGTAPTSNTATIQVPSFVTGTTYYFKVAATDLYGPGTPNYSTEFSCVAP